jgi:hypothetical protein
MSRPTYLSGDDIADAHNANGCGVSLETIASKLGVTVQELRVAMGLPQWRDAPASSANSEPDLWAVDRLEAQL